MKKLRCALAAILMCLTACLCSACGTEERQPANVTQNTQTFITIVSQIQDKVTVDDGLKIEVALLVYDHLNDTEKGNPEVSASKTRLDGLKDKYDVVKAEADRQAEIKREEKLVANFINAVNELSINKLKLSDEATVTALMEDYEQLKDESKSKSEVYAAYSKLRDAEDRIAELKEEARQEDIKATAEKFIETVEDLLKEIADTDEDERDEAILGAAIAFDDLYYEYDNEFEDEVKEYEGVAEAKEKLDGLYAQYCVLKDDKDVKDLKELAEKISPVEDKVTLASEDDIIKAEGIYDKMSAEAKAVEGVTEAYAIVQQAREKYDALFAVAENERIQIFIAAANNVRTDIENLDILWFDALDAASQAYYSLTYASQKLPEVQEAYARWNTAQKAFNNKGYKRIPMGEPTLVYSGDVPPHIVLQNHANIWNPIVQHYGLNSYTEISSQAKVWLNVYVNGVYIGHGEVDTTKLIDSGHIIPGSEVVGVLKALSAEHSEIVTGGSFGFTRSVEDRENRFIPSAQSKVSAPKA